GQFHEIPEEQDRNYQKRVLFKGMQRTPFRWSVLGNKILVRIDLRFETLIEHRDTDSVWVVSDDGQILNLGNTRFQRGPAPLPPTKGDIERLSAGYRKIEEQRQR